MLLRSRSASALILSYKSLSILIDVGWILLLPMAITSKRVYMKCEKMQILLNYKRSDCYYVCVVAKNMRYYMPARVGNRAGGMLV